MKSLPERMEFYLVLLVDCQARACHTRPGQTEFAFTLQVVSPPQPLASTTSPDKHRRRHNARTSTVLNPQ
jgi:hypothetical protein